MARPSFESFASVEMACERRARRTVLDGAAESA